MSAVQASGSQKVRGDDMRRLLFVVVMLILAVPAIAGQPHYYVSVAATQTNTNTDIEANLGLPAHTVIIRNDGANEVFFDVLDGVATTSDGRLDSGESITITSGGGEYPITNVGLICSAGETATVRLYAFPSK